MKYGQGADLSADLSAENQFALVFDVADYQGPISITVTTTGSGTSSASGSTPSGLQSSDDDVWVYFPFSSFAGTASFADIDQIAITVDGPSEADYTLKGVVAMIPEPGSLVLFSLLGALILRFRLRRQS